MAIQKEESSPLLTTVLEHVGTLSDRDFNDPLALVSAIVDGKIEGLARENQIDGNPFREKYGRRFGFAQTQIDKKMR